MESTFDKTVQRKIWDVELEILDVIDKVCKGNGLHYSLAYGSMLGAVRHQGFIPWDDDMDIWMPRKDYNQFIEIWEQHPQNGYFLLRQETSPKYPQNFMKIRKNGTAFVSKGEENTEYHHGIFVDIFPMDKVCNNSIGAKTQSISALFYMLYCRGYVSNHDGFLAHLFGNILLKGIPKIFQKRIKKFFFNQTQKYNDEDYQADKIVCFVTAKDAFIYYDNTAFEEWSSIKFENRTYMCNKNTDDLLKTYYGDYMQLPPPEERVWKHHPVLIDFEKEYWP